MGRGGRGVKGEIPKVRNSRVEEATGERKGRSLGIGGEKVEEKGRWRGKKGRGRFQERIEGESNLLRRTHTPLSILLRPPRGSPCRAENSHKRRSANTCTSRYIVPLCPAHGNGASSSSHSSMSNSTFTLPTGQPDHHPLALATIHESPFSGIRTLA